MKYEFTPKTGLGPLKFGMSPDDIRSILGDGFQAEEIEGLRSEYYKHLGIEVRYDKDDTCCFILVSYSLDIPIIPVFQNKPLVDVLFQEVIQFLCPLDKDLIYCDDFGLHTSYFGFRVYNDISLESPAIAASFFRDGFVSGEDEVLSESSSIINCQDLEFIDLNDYYILEYRSEYDQCEFHPHVVSSFEEAVEDGYFYHGIDDLTLGQWGDDESFKLMKIFRGINQVGRITHWPKGKFQNL